MSKSADWDTTTAYGPDTVLTPAEVCAYLKVSPRTVDRMQLPWSRVGPQRRRILFRLLVAHLEKMAA